MAGAQTELTVVVIGAGVGGLAAAARFAKAGLPVTVLEGHTYPGGSAGSFFHEGYRFDAGATVAGGYAPGEIMHQLAPDLGIGEWAAVPTEPAMAVRLPDGALISRWGDQRRHESRRAVFGAEGERFWQWQESAADLAWALARLPVIWPPASASELSGLVMEVGDALPELRQHDLSPARLFDLVRPVSDRLKGSSERLRAFVDAQLLISAQAMSQNVVALYGAAALDLPRRGTVEFPGGMGSLSQQLVAAIRSHGGQVHYRQRAMAIQREHGKPQAVLTDRGSFPAEIVVANLTPAALDGLLAESALRPARPAYPKDGWGAFTLYVGLDRSVAERLPARHLQLLAPGFPRAGRAVFLSASPPWDASRAPLGRRAVTISTHTRPDRWWDLLTRDLAAYDESKRAFRQEILDIVEAAIPGFIEASDPVLEGTPVTFEHYTGRPGGWVGGYPQTHLLRASGPRIAPGIWMVGDSIFPGQSTTAVTLGAVRVAQQILGELDLTKHNGIGTRASASPRPYTSHFGKGGVKWSAPERLNPSQIDPGR